MKRLNLVGLTAALALALSGPAQAATYKWVDKDGTVHYSQQPPAGSNYEKLNIKTPPPNYNPSASQPAASTQSKGGSEDTRSDDLIKKEMAKGKELREKNCEQAKKSLELYTAYRRVLDKDGNVIVLDDNERAKRIEESKQAVKDFCE